MSTTQAQSDSLSEAWEIWCNRGRPSVGHRRRAVTKCMNARGEVRGYYSNLILDPTLPPTHSLYPSIDHVVTVGVKYSQQRSG